MAHRDFFDPTFGTNGIADIVPPGNFPNEMSLVELDPFGRIIVYGRYQRVTPVGYRMGATRLKHDGSVDLAFGDEGDGFLTAPETVQGHRIHKLCFQKNGDFAVTGEAGAQLPLVIFDKDGKLKVDASFLDAPQLFSPHLLTLPCGKLMMAGSDALGGTLYRRHADGSPDLEFGSAGRTRFLSGYVPTRDMLASAGETSFFVCGAYGNDGFVGKFDHDGLPVPSFGERGFRILGAQGLQYATCRSLRATLDGKLLTVVDGSGGGEPGWYLTRLLKDGTTDATFNRGQPLGLPGTVSAGLATYPDGRIVAGANEALSGESYLFRLLPNGLRDDSFGTRGEVRLSLEELRLHSVVVQPNGKIVAGGTVGTRGRVIRLLP